MSVCINITWLEALVHKLHYCVPGFICIVKRKCYKQVPNYSQQDAMFLNLLISTDALHVSGSSSAHHQEHNNCTCRFRYCQPILLLAAIMDEMELCSISSMIAASSSIGWQYLKLHVQLLCSWWWVEELPETCRASVEVSKLRNVASCWL